MKKKRIDNILNKKFVGILLLFLMILVISLKHKTNPLNTNNLPIYEPSRIQDSSTYQKYEDPVEGLSFLYSNKYRLQNIKDGSIGFQYANNKLENSIAVIRTIIVPEGKSTLDYSIEKYSNWLSGGWSGVKFDTDKYSRKIVGQEIFNFTTPNHLNGYEMYFKTEILNLSKNRVTEKQTWGPLFIVELSKDTPASKRVLLAHASFKPSREQLEILKKLVDSAQNLE